MPEIYFRIPGKPRGKGRPRFSRFGHAFTPKETRQYEEKVAAIAKEKMRNNDLLQCPVEVVIEAHGGIYQSWSMKDKGRFYGEPWDGKPDADNILKIVCDSLNGIVWKDDSQVWSAQIVKTWDDDHYVDVRILWDD